MSPVLRSLLENRAARTGALAGGGGLLALADPNIPILGSARNLIANELLGLDDFRRVARYAKEGDFGKMLKSLGAGVFELGSTVIPGGQILKAGKVAGKATKALQAARGADEALDLAKVLKTRQIKELERTGRMLTGPEARYAGDIIAASPIGGRVVSRIPGMARTVDGVTELTGAGRLGLQGFRAGETAQIADLLNAGSAGFGGPSAPIGTARDVMADMQEQARLQALAQMLDQMYGQVYGGL